AAAPGAATAPGAGAAPTGDGGPATPGAGGLDLGSGVAPIAPPVPLEWVAEVWVDPDWYAAQDQADQPCPSPGLPTTVPLTVRSLLVGRVSRSRNIHPEIDCGTDSAVSRRQAQLTTDGTRWFVEDLQSSNGTYVGPASGPLPTVPLVAGQRRELAEDDRVYVGAWTRLVVRRATDEERAAG
ncbi:FHA domain-containing protein, partial [Actinotalea solisilvae]|uniref:FHA domain-containing protein n=1 Tax=Actinotalea solisilvae TaxID=2072922 RepID=UPI001F409EFF